MKKKYAFRSEKMSYGLRLVGEKLRGEMRYGYENLHGELQIPIEYDVAWAFDRGVARVSKIFENDGQKIQLWGIIDIQGDFILPMEYDLITAPSGSFMHVRLNHKWGAFHLPSSKLQISIDYDWIYPWHKGEAVVRIGKSMV
jgi:hypothetical protein